MKVMGAASLERDDAGGVGRACSPRPKPSHGGLSADFAPRRLPYSGGLLDYAM